MRKYIKIPFLGMLFVLLILSGCYDQDVAPVGSPDIYPTASFSTDLTGNEVTEGDTVTIIITLSKMYDYDISFSAEEVSTSSDHLYEVEDVVIPKYSTQAEMQLIILDDGMPSQETQNLQLEIGAFAIEDRYKVHPNTENLALDLTINNYNDPTLLTIVFDWSSADDIDIVTWSNTSEYPMTEWGDGGATTAQPEMDQSIWLADPIGEYYVNIMHWGAPTFDYTFTLGYPDGSVETITGTFDADNLGQYTNDPWTAWGGSYDSYRILKVENDGEKFVVTQL